METVFKSRTRARFFVLEFLLDSQRDGVDFAAEGEEGWLLVCK